MSKKRPNNHLSSVIAVRFTDAEVSVIQAEARKEERPPSSWIRRLVRATLAQRLQVKR